MELHEWLAEFYTKPRKMSLSESISFENLIRGSPQEKSFQEFADLLMGPLQKKYSNKPSYSRWSPSPTGDRKDMMTRFCSSELPGSARDLDLVMYYRANDGSGEFYFGKRVYYGDDDTALLISSSIIPRIYVSVKTRGLKFIRNASLNSESNFSVSDGGLGIYGFYYHHTAKDIGELILHIDNVIDEERRNFRTPEPLRNKD